MIITRPRSTSAAASGWPPGSLASIGRSAPTPAAPGSATLGKAATGLDPHGHLLVAFTGHSDREPADPDEPPGIVWCVHGGTLPFAEVPPCCPSCRPPRSSPPCRHLLCRAVRLHHPRHRGPAGRMRRDTGPGAGWPAECGRSRLCGIFGGRFPAKPGQSAWSGKGFRPCSPRSPSAHA